MDSVTSAAMALLRSGTPVPGSLAGYLTAALRRRVSPGSQAPRPEPNDAPPAEIVALGEAIARQLVEDDRRLLARLGERGVGRDVTEWVGMSFGGARVRVLKLRERLRTVARQHAATLAPDQRVMLERWLNSPPLPGAMRTRSSPVPRDSRSTPSHRPA